MKKLLLLAAIALTTSFAASAKPECNPWASTSATTAVATATVSKTAGCAIAKSEKKETATEHKSATKQRSDNMHVSAHQQAISHQHPQK